MQSLIDGQTISVDAHTIGQEPKFENLHLHKKINRHNKSIDMRIPVDENREISFTKDSKKYEPEIINEIKKVFKKDNKKLKEFVREVISEIKKYPEIEKLEKEKQRIILVKYAERLAEYFNLRKIVDVMTSELDNKINFIISSHLYQNKLYYIKQDLFRKYICIGDDLEQIFYRNEIHYDFEENY